MKLLSWIGTADFAAWKNDRADGDGPLLSVAKQVRPKYVEILWDDGSRKVPLADSASYSTWLQSQLGGAGIDAEIRIHPCDDAKVVDFAWVYQQLESLRKGSDLDGAFINASSGTPVMFACWIVFKKATGLNMQLFRSSVEKGVEAIELPPLLTIDMTEIFQGRRSPLLDSYIKGEFQFDKNVFRDISHESDRMKQTLVEASMVSKFTEVTVLLLGPPGTGKSRLAKIIHDQSGVGKEKWLPVDCGSLTDERSLGELWGWIKGAFTGAHNDYEGLIKSADKGSLFLDEVGNASVILQQNLLRLLQEKKYRPLHSPKEYEIDTRVIAATNSDLRNMVREGRFRQDLFDRLSVWVIQVPSLKELADDIIPIARNLLNVFNERWKTEIENANGKCKTLTGDAERELKRYDWPGNVRELENVVKRLVLRTIGQAGRISADDVRQELNSPLASARGSLLDESIGNGFELEDVLNKVRFHYVQRAWKESNGIRTKMAELLGWNKKNRTPLKTLLKNLQDAGYDLEDI